MLLEPSQTDKWIGAMSFQLYCFFFFLQKQKSVAKSCRFVIFLFHVTLGRDLPVLCLRVFILLGQ